MVDKLDFCEKPTGYHLLPASAGAPTAPRDARDVAALPAAIWQEASTFLMMRREPSRKPTAGEKMSYLFCGVCCFPAGSVDVWIV